MNSRQDFDSFPTNEQSLAACQDEQLAETVTLLNNEIFRALLLDSGLKVDEQGIYQDHKAGITIISNFSNITYLFNKIQGNQKLRLLKIGDYIFKFTPENLVNRNNLRKLLLSANYDLSCTDHQFYKLVKIIIKNLNSPDTINKFTKKRVRKVR